MPKEVEQFGKWYLRFNDGVTRRANSVLPIGLPNETDMEDAIDHVIRFYIERGTLPRFQMTNYSAPGSLDDILERKGFARHFPVFVETASISGIPQRSQSITTKIFSTPTDEWMKAYESGSGYSAITMNIRKSLMMRSPLPKAFGAAIIDANLVAVGLCVKSDEWCGLFNIATVPDYRRSGAGTAVSCRLLSWARKLGASKAYLQVEMENHPAFALYQQLGFEILYEYWYRVMEVEH